MTSQHTELIHRLQEELGKAASAKTKDWWDRYLKGEIVFRGVGIPRIRMILASWRSETGVAAWPEREQFTLALRLIAEPIAEDKLAGILLLQEYAHEAVPWREAVRRYAELFESGCIADWNTCDWFCVRVLGPMIAAHGRGCADAVAKWSTAPELWKARASVVGFVPLVEQTGYRALVLQSAAVLIRREERFAKTAVGWILRTISKHDDRPVQDFLDEHIVHFSVESLRNALKYAPAETLRRYLVTRTSPTR